MAAYSAKQITTREKEKLLKKLNEFEKIQKSVHAHTALTSQESFSTDELRT
jgi:hypothetical protein